MHINWLPRINNWNMDHVTCLVYWLGVQAKTTIGMFGLYNVDTQPSNKQQT